MESGDLLHMPGKKGKKVNTLLRICWTGWGRGGKRGGERKEKPVVKYHTVITTEYLRG